MKKTIFIIIVLVFVFFGLKQVKAWDITNTWDYMPIGHNYLDPENHGFIEHENMNYTFETINPFIIEAGKSYSFHLTSPFEEITSYLISFYDSSNNVIASPIFTEVKDDEARLKSINFITPNEACRVGIKVDFLHFRDMPQEYDEDGIDSHFVFLMGWDCLDRNFVDLHYKGPRDLEPVFAGEQGLYITNVNDPIDVLDIKAYLKAYDDTDGDVSASIIIYEDNYTANKYSLGTYPVIFRANDSNNNYTDLIINVAVVDIDGPSFVGGLEVIGNSATKLELATIKANLVVNDNYDAANDILIEILEDNYSSNYSIVGEYEIKYQATDTSGNKSIGVVVVRVEDGIIPVISGPVNHSKSNAINVDLADFLSLYTAEDETAGNITSRIEVISDNYTLNQANTGVWDVVLGVRDDANNLGTLVIKIEVIDNLGPVFFVDSTKIVIDLSINSLNLNNIINTLQAAKIIKEDLVIEVLEDNYSTNLDIPGNYKVLLGYQGSELELEIEVIEKLPEIEDMEEINFFQKILNFFSNIFKLIKNFFKFLFYKG